ncbi:multi antimicrobial extrusion protein MatE [Metabacillus arenae]|uniref:Multi antimicrobial extrusion protein MatE n=1 Tax=Metabacillus arenae TaxID=2771434 RepID=A0A926RYX3_9BACI|nr:multi antimicrobial extrusion protein MatE [Metabacillus arenae]MBD1382531.1 multi antimicrobial extrusion protein MatE [Metabacillus arenae]
MTIKQENQFKIKTLLFFFIPLGLSASLVTLSHIIINSTLARSDNSEVIIAGYAIAMSLFAVTERLGVILRQTCSALVRDKGSVKLMMIFSFYIIASLLIVSLAVAYTSFGNFIFSTIYGIKNELVKQIKEIYQVLIIVTIFSALRCFSQGIIIYNRQTKWLTMGMGIRLIFMYLLSLYFIHTGNITGRTGAYIFLCGMIIECIVSVIEARLLVRKMPVRKKPNIKSKFEIFQFYSPLMLSSFITVSIGPAINIFLGKTEETELAIASYAIALSVIQLVLSFFSYIHQIVINFYDQHEVKVKRFTFMISFIPVIIIGILCYTPLGVYFLEQVMGIKNQLLIESLKALKVFMLMALAFPFVDFFNGLLMLRKKTKVTIISQSANLIITLTILFVCIKMTSGWNGSIGALAQSVGLAGELIVLYGIFQSNKQSNRKTNIFTYGKEVDKA